MKNSISQSTLLLGLVLLIIGMSSCTGLRDSAITVMEPAKINFPKSIQSFVVVNRAAPSRPGWNVLEGVLTGELPGQDRDAARAVVAHLARGIDESPRFSAKAANVELIADPRKPMDWKRIEKLTETYDVDAVVVLENIDSDSRADWWGDDNREIRAGLHLFFRVYDPIKKKIVDEYNFTKRGRTNDYNYNIIDRVTDIPNRYAMTNDLGFAAGREYARQIAPSFATRERKIYKKAERSQEMRDAYRLARNGQWVEAAEIWDSLADSDKEKLAARASFNMALASEQIGELMNAQEWVDYSDDLLKRKVNAQYMRTLKRRVAEQERVDAQMARVEVPAENETSENNEPKD